MELNDTLYSKHEQASTRLKLLMLIFALVVIGALTFLVLAEQRTPDPVPEPVIITQPPATENEDLTDIVEN